MTETYKIEKDGDVFHFQVGFGEDIIRIPSSGMKWWISSGLMEKLETNASPKNSFGEFYYDIELPGLVLRVCYRDSDFITVSGDGGYIGLSRTDDGWHIGTPAFAMSRPLIDAMERLRRRPEEELIEEELVKMLDDL